jgi:hypothetical protein
VLLGEGRTFKLLAAPRANGHPAFGIYVRQPGDAVLRAGGLMVVALAGNEISALTRFDNRVLQRFGLPSTLTD